MFLNYLDHSDAVGTQHQITIFVLPNFKFYYGLVISSSSSSDFIWFETLMAQINFIFVSWLINEN